MGSGFRIEESAIPKSTVPAPVWSAFAFLLFLPSFVFSQGTSGPPGGSGATAVHYLEGQVFTQGAGEPLRGVRVTIINFRGVTRASTVTDVKGGFVCQLPAGQYTLRFELSGFQEQTIQIELMMGGLRDLQVTMPRRQRPEDAVPGVPVSAWTLRVPNKAKKEYDRGIAALKEHDSRTSLRFLEAAIQQYPGFAAAYAALGSAHLNLGDEEAALAAFEKGLAIDENLLGACLGLGTIYTRQKRYADAEKYLLRARLLKSDDWRIHHQLGEVYLSVGNWALAEASLRRAIELGSTFPRSQLLLINALVMPEKYVDALNEMDSFLQRFPKDPFAAQVSYRREQLRQEIRQGALSQTRRKP